MRPLQPATPLRVSASSRARARSESANRRPHTFRLQHDLTPSPLISRHAEVFSPAASGLLPQCPGTHEPMARARGSLCASWDMTMMMMMMFGSPTVALSGDPSGSPIQIILRSVAIYMQIFIYHFWGGAVNWKGYAYIHNQRGGGGQMAERGGSGHTTARYFYTIMQMLNEWSSIASHFGLCPGIMVDVLTHSAFPIPCDRPRACSILAPCCGSSTFSSPGAVRRRRR